MSAPPPYRYQVGGSLTQQAPSYVERPADSLLYQKLSGGEYCYVLNARQMGKSSLLVRTKARLTAAGHLCLALDLTGLGGRTATAEQWYKGLVMQLCMATGLVSQFNLKQWWSAHSDLLLIQRLKIFLETVLLSKFSEQSIIICLDEIDAVLSLPFSTDEFFAFIRFCFNQRALNPEYRRITFSLFGVVNPSELVKNPSLTPFNIGSLIELNGFTLDQISPLTGGLLVSDEAAQSLLAEILDWTAGQPFLTHKLARLTGESIQTEVAEKLSAPAESTLRDLSSANGRSETVAIKREQPLVQASASSSFTLDSEKLPNSSQRIEAIVQTKILQDWKRQDQPEHLATIAKRILANPLLSPRLLGLYQSILMGDKIALDQSSAQMELMLSGLVIEKDGKLQVKNRIYASIFNLAWVTQELNNLRPYNVEFQAWLESEQQDDRLLLRGSKLDQSLTWSQNKQLSDTDYRFLAASQALVQEATKQALVYAKQEQELAERTVQSLKEATKLYSAAKHQAKQQIRQIRLGKWWSAGIAFSVGAGIVLARLAGLMQGLEGSALDHFFRLRSHSGLDPRITLITIDEPDINAMGIYPIPDQILAQAIAQLNQHNPRVIGVDLYRDVPVQPGHELLLQAFANSPHLIGIEKRIEPMIPPPPSLVEPSQVGFADQIVDADGSVRRALLSVTDPDGQNLHLSFALQLTLKYLADEGITAQPLEQGSIQLGEATIVPFRPNQTGFYHQADNGGFQILMNYSGPKAAFHSISLQDVVAGTFDPTLVEDRLLILGYTADSVNDLFPSPFRQNWSNDAESMAGMTLHANGVSQLINAALDGRPLLQIWSRLVETAWILLWTSLGAALAWQARRLHWQLLTLFGGTGLLLSITWLAFLQGWWIPWVPSILGYGIAAILLAGMTLKQEETWQLQRMVVLLSETARERHLEGTVALEYLKQIEGREPRKRQLLNQWMHQQSCDRRKISEPAQANNLKG